jgi:hypothetical protein
VKQKLKRLSGRTNTFFAKSTPTRIIFIVDSFSLLTSGFNPSLAPRCRVVGEEESIPLLLRKLDICQRENRGRTTPSRA